MHSFQLHQGSLNVIKDPKKRKEKNVIAQVVAETQDLNSMGQCSMGHTHCLRIFNMKHPTSHFNRKKNDIFTKMI